MNVSTERGLGWRTAGRLIGLSLCLVLGGCAAQRSHDDGARRIAQGDWQEGIARLEAAARLAPDNVAYRLTWQRAREKRVQDLADEAQRLERLQQPEAARERWKAVLALDERHARAQQALVPPTEAPAQPSTGTPTSRETVARRPDAAAETLPLPPRLREAYRQPIGIQFKDVSLQAVLDVIARTAGLNILLDKDVRSDQKTTIYLKDSTIERALSVIQLTQQLALRVVDDNTVLLYPNTAAKHKDYQPLSVASFYLEHAEAKGVAATLKTLLKSQHVVVDDKLNLLIVRDTPEALTLAKRLVALHDVAEPEVLLDVEILEVKRSTLLNLGLRWPDQLSLTPLPGTAGDTLRLSELRNLSSATTGAAIGPLTLNLRKTDGDANILANPRIRVRNREKARVLIGERVPNITATSTATGFVAESVNYVDVGLKLDVEPTVYVGDEVAIKVSLEVSNIISQLQTKQGSVAFQIGTRLAQTVLRLRDGETQLLAGLINDEDRRSANKVPALGELPVLGRLFGQQTDDRTKTEIMLSITPRVLRAVTPPAESRRPFATGTENALDSARPEEPPAPTKPTSPSSPARVPDVTPSPDPSPNRPSEGRSPLAGPAAPPGSAAIAAPSTPAPAAPLPALRWHGPALVAAGQTFRVTLRLEAGDAAGEWPLALQFDPQRLQLLAVHPSAHSRIDPAGQVLLRTQPQAGDLVTLEWRALRAGPTGLRWLQALVTRPDGSPWPVERSDWLIDIKAGP